MQFVIGVSTGAGTIKSCPKFGDLLADQATRALIPERRSCADAPMLSASLSG